MGGVCSTNRKRTGSLARGTAENVQLYNIKTRSYGEGMKEFYQCVRETESRFVSSARPTSHTTAQHATTKHMESSFAVK